MKQQQKGSTKRKASSTASTTPRLVLPPAVPVITGKENTHKSGDLPLVDDDALLLAALEAAGKRLSQSQGIISDGNSSKKQKLC